MKLECLLGSVGLLIAATSLAEAQSGVDLYKENCNSCHSSQAKGADRIAPPIFAVKNHYSDMQSDKDAFIEAISSWALKPDQKKSRMPGAVGKFGLMEPVEITKEQANKIAEFIFSTDFKQPDWYAKTLSRRAWKRPRLNATCKKPPISLATKCLRLARQSAEQEERTV